MSGAESVLRILRLEKGLTLEAVASAGGVSTNGYYQVEAGQRSTSPRVAAKIAGFLGVPLDSIFVPSSFSIRKMEGDNGEEA